MTDDGRLSRSSERLNIAVGCLHICVIERSKRATDTVEKETLCLFLRFLWDFLKGESASKLCHPAAD